MSPSYELEKLELVDLKIATWMNAHHPHLLPNYFAFIQPAYIEKGIDLNIPRLLAEFSGARGQD